MKSSRAVVSLAAGLFIILLALNSGLMYAAELKGTVGGSLNALNTGYAITRWPWTGGDIRVGQDAQVRACTTLPPYPEATQVVFRWNLPDGSHFDIGPKDLTLSDDTWDGKPIYDAYDTQALEVLGNWGVQALFIGEEGKLQGPNPYPIATIKAISWHIIPEVPLGTIVTLLGMFGGMCVFAIVRRKGAISRIP